MDWILGIVEGIEIIYQLKGMIPGKITSSMDKKVREDGQSAFSTISSSRGGLFSSKQGSKKTHNIAVSLAPTLGT
ncbi:hypothetical protein DMENIID0001_145510 [Sergentomyia squamirostris]